MHVPFSFKILVLVLFFSGSGFSSLTSAQEPLRFAPLPMVPERLLKHDFESFAEYLSQQTNRPVELVLEKSYRKLLDSLLADKIDLAYLGPLPFVFLTQQDPSFVPIVRFVDKSADQHTPVVWPTFAVITSMSIQIVHCWFLCPNPIRLVVI